MICTSSSVWVAVVIMKKNKNKKMQSYLPFAEFSNSMTPVQVFHAVFEKNSSVRPACCCEASRRVNETLLGCQFRVPSSGPVSGMYVESTYSGWGWGQWQQINVFPASLSRSVWKIICQDLSVNWNVKNKIRWDPAGCVFT
jgi:hypothetical protein